MMRASQFYVPTPSETPALHPGGGEERIVLVISLTCRLTLSFFVDFGVECDGGERANVLGLGKEIEEHTGNEGWGVRSSRRRCVGISPGRNW